MFHSANARLATGACMNFSPSSNPWYACLRGKLRFKNGPILVRANYANFSASMGISTFTACNLPVDVVMPHTFCFFVLA